MHHPQSIARPVLIARFQKHLHRRKDHVMFDALSAGFDWRQGQTEISAARTHQAMSHPPIVDLVLNVDQDLPRLVRVRLFRSRVELHMPPFTCGHGCF